MAIVSEKKDNLIEVYAVYQDKEEKVAVVRPEKTGTSKDFRDIEISLDKPIRGKCKLVFQFRNSGFCYFTGWKYNRPSK